MSRLLHELEDSVCSRRRLIQEDSRETLRKIGALGIVDSINELIDSNNQSIIQKNDYSEQIDIADSGEWGAWDEDDVDAVGNEEDAENNEDEEVKTIGAEIKDISIKGCEPTNVTS